MNLTSSPKVQHFSESWNPMQTQSLIIFLQLFFFLQAHKIFNVSHFSCLEISPRAREAASVAIKIHLNITENMCVRKHTKMQMSPSFGVSRLCPDHPKRYDSTYELLSAGLSDISAAAQTQEVVHRKSREVSRGVSRSPSQPASQPVCGLVYQCSDIGTETEERLSLSWASMNYVIKELNLSTKGERVHNNNKKGRRKPPD